MPEPSELSRRERQIMDAVFALGEATVNKVVETIPSPPTAMAVRRMMHILEEKGHLRRRARQSGECSLCSSPDQRQGRTARIRASAGDVFWRLSRRSTRRAFALAKRPGVGRRA